MTRPGWGIWPLPELQTGLLIPRWSAEGPLMSLSVMVRGASSPPHGAGVTTFVVQ